MVDDGWRSRVEALVDAAGYGPDDPLVVGVQPAASPAVLVGRGQTLDGAAVGAATPVYAASLAKQVTAVCTALLVRQGRLTLGSSLTTWLPELPGWASGVRVRHLLWHTGGLPEVCSYEELERAGLDRTTRGVVDALAARGRLEHPAGQEHRYSNAGYVCLALVVARVTGQPFAHAARNLVLDPLGLAGSRWWAGPGARPPRAAPLAPPHPAALSLGDGGLWSTAADLLRWNEAMHHDTLGVAAVVQTPGHLDDGTPLDYAWGVGVRERAGRRLYRHGGLWAGLNAQLVRVADDGSGFVVLALDLDEERTATLAESLLEALVPSHPNPREDACTS